MRIENSFIPIDGVGEHTERRLWRQGVTHWDDFERAALGPATGRKVEAYIDEAVDRLSTGDVDFFDERFPSGSRWRMYENFVDDTCFLDIETTGLDRTRHDVTVVSLHRAGETSTLVRGDDLTRSRLQDALAGTALLVTFNGKRFDVPFLESAFDLSIDVPHLDLMYPCRRLDLTGGLKAIERAVGIARDGPDIGGRDAVRLWHAHRAGRDGALDTLVSYNRDDTVNLERLTEVVVDRLDETVFAVAANDAQRRLG